MQDKHFVVHRRTGTPEIVLLNGKICVHVTEKNLLFLKKKLAEVRYRRVPIQDVISLNELSISSKTRRFGPVSNL